MLIYNFLNYFITSIPKAFLTKHIKLLFVQLQFQPTKHLFFKLTSTKSTFYKTTFFKPQPQQLSQYQTHTTPDSHV
jgi:hypothetical protein